MRSTSLILTLAATASSLLLATACGRLDPPYVLSPAKSCPKLQAEIRQQALIQIQADYAWHLNFGFIGGGAESNSLQDAGAPMAAGARSKSSSPSRIHSDTNVQVKGVDEADLVETDGTYLFSLAGDHLIITKAWPAAESAEVGRLKIEGQASGFYLKETERKIAVLSRLIYQQAMPSSGQTSQVLSANEPSVKISLVDVSDPANPVLERETYIEGVLFDSRLVDSRLVVVTYTDLAIPGLYEANTKDEAMRAVRKSSVNDWMPKRFDNLKLKGSWTATDSDVCGCEEVLVSDRQSGTNMVTLTSLDVLDATKAVQASSVLGNVNTVYANGSSFYVFSPEAKEGPFRSYDNRVETVVHRFSLTDSSAAPTYEGSGKVPGWLLNQFSVDEFEGRLRLATTDQSGSARNFEPSASLYVLELKGKELKRVGALEPLVENESIYAVRFVDNRGYVVTFRQIDPLFIVDLKDPHYPEAKGALEMPGFSNYLHPMDATHLLGIGMADGWGGNAQISLFDVSDETQPQLDSRLTLATGWSAAQSEHHAFNYFAPQEALFVPVMSQTSSSSEIHVIHAKVGDTLMDQGHASNESLRRAAGFAGSEYDDCIGQRRSVVIENVLYAVSGAGILVTEARNPQTVLASVPFTGIDPCADEAVSGRAFNEGRGF